MTKPNSKKSIVLQGSPQQLVEMMGTSSVRDNSESGFRLFGGDPKEDFKVWVSWVDRYGKVNNIASKQLAAQWRYWL